MRAFRYAVAAEETRVALRALGFGVETVRGEILATIGISQDGAVQLMPGGSIEIDADALQFNYVALPCGADVMTCDGIPYAIDTSGAGETSAARLHAELTAIFPGARMGGRRYRGAPRATIVEAGSTDEDRAYADAFAAACGGQ